MISKRKVGMVERWENGKRGNRKFETP